MPTRKPDAHRALELLEEYHSTLTASDDTPLRSAIERVIRIFRSRLFQALLDIQQFYEDTLLDANKTSTAKTSVALEMASRWERQSPLPGGPDKGRAASLPRTSPGSGHNASHDPNDRRDSRKSSDDIDSTASLPRLAAAAPASSNGSKDEFEEHVIVLVKQAGKGLGFSVAGGIGNNHFPGDNGIYVTMILPGSIALQDGRLRVNDCLLQVNDVHLVDVTHAIAVQALKETSSTVVLRIKRKREADVVDAKPVMSVAPPTENSVIHLTLLKQERGLGFSIAGGVNNEHIEGDPSIFIIKISPGGVADKDGRMSVGDRLLKVNETSLEKVGHDTAVAELQKAAGPTELVIQRTSYSKALQENAYESVIQPVKKYCSDQRHVKLQKGSQGLGFNIVGSEDCVYISFILSGGVADTNGLLKRGDRILEVNDVDLSHGSHDKAAATLKGAQGLVTIIVAYRPEEYGKFEAKIQEIRQSLPTASPGGTLKTSAKKSLYVRAQFAYDKTKDPSLPGEGLSFQVGDILHVVNASDDEWWQARRVNPQTGEDEGLQGVIPSRARVQRRERSRLRSVKFIGGEDVDEKPEKEKPARGSGSVGRRRSFTFKMRLPFFKKDSGKDKKAKGSQDEAILSYVDVRCEEIHYKRPIILLGPAKDRINDDLQQDMPDKYSTCVPHTTRPPREFEVDGRDYHFVSSRQKMENDIQNHLFIDAGTYNDNFYGTSIESVNDVAFKQQKHCVLDVSGYAIRRLQVAGLYPITIFLKPTSAESVKDQNRRMTDEQARKTFDRATKLEQEFGEYFTAVVQVDDLDTTYSQVKYIIEQNAGSSIWVPTSPEV